MFQEQRQVSIKISASGCLYVGWIFLINKLLLLELTFY